MQAHARTHNPHGLLALALAVGALGCGVAQSGAGTACHASSECATGLCSVNLCLVPGRDDDGDGLDNATEHALGSNPLSADTDGDGKPDGAEAGADPAHPSNTDGDALADLLESAVLDSDRDCLADEEDAQNAVPETNGAVLAAIGCAHVGVCAAAKPAIGATCKNAVLTCDYHAVPGFATAELCDGKDNDCDGEVDEGFAYGGGGIGEPCDGVGACGAGIVECRGAKADCSSNPGASHDQAKAESCNGVDDNCDGAVDEGFLFNGLPIGSPCLGTGECGLGVVECGTGGEPRCSSNPSGSSAQVKAETCNGLDDDCDGATDNGLSWQGIGLGGACQTTGVCGAGQVICDAAGQANCSSAPGVVGSKAQAEICNGLDDNCNGTTDEGFDYEGIALGASCPAEGVCGAGIVVCNAIGAAACSTHQQAPAGQASLEICNGLDDDCDGDTDEQLSWQGHALGSGCDGTGACGIGVVQCGKEGQVTCSTNPDGSASQAQIETCNGLDDDCNGQIDDQIATTPALACATTGVCQGGSAVLMCAGGGWKCAFTNPAFQITETTCDGLDNDCDGLTDEGLPLTWLPPQVAWTTQPNARTELATARDKQGLYVTGGLVDSILPGAGPVAAGDVWRLDLESLAWAQVAHNPLLARRSAGAVLLPGAAGSAAHLMLVGGLDAAGAPAAPLVLDLGAGTIGAPYWNNQPQHRFSPALVHLAPAQQVWMFGGTAAGTGVAAQRLDLTTGTWSATVPQPASAIGPVAGCADDAGNLYAFGHSVAGDSFFSVLPAGAAAWQVLPNVPGQPGQPGRLLCDVAAGEVWLVGGLAQGGIPQPARKFVVSGQQWIALPSGKQPSGASTQSWPDAISPAVAVHNGQLIVALGQTTDGYGLSASWIGVPGDWSVIASGPEPVVGARLFATADSLIRVGGAALRVGMAVTNIPVWRNQAGVWTAWSNANSTGRMFASVVAEPDGQALLQWGGLATAPADGDWQSALDTSLPAPGADRLNLKTGQWESLSESVQQLLPFLRPDAAVAAGQLPGQWFIFGSHPSTLVSQLWLIDLAAANKTLVWQGPDQSSASSPTTPTWQSGSAMTWDPNWGRLVLATPGPQVTIWQYNFGPSGGWSPSATVGAMPGRLQLLGANDASERLLIASSVVTPVSARRLNLDVDIAVVADLTPQLQLYGMPATATTLTGAMGWLTEPTDALGVLQPAWLKWPHQCQP